MADTFYIKVSGWVQNVNFRHETRLQALDLGLKGWVRNTPDGGVEILAQGEKENLEKLLAWAKQGPPAAEVDIINFEWREGGTALENFEIAH